MAEPQITPELRELIERHLGSLDEIEVLLALYGQRGRRAPVPDVAASVRKPESAVRDHLAQLVERGFIQAHDGGQSYSYPEQESKVEQPMEELARMYEQRPVTLIKALYDRPSNAVLSFADAFRLRKT
jgi:predicted transcriptional regulator